MEKHQKTEKQFLLKDMLFNRAKVAKLASEITAVYPEFKKTAFEKKVVSAFPAQELMERIAGIRDALYEFLPRDYKEAVAIIVAALPPPLDPEKTDDDFGEFIYAPYSYYVAKYGCTKKELSRSLNALEEITKRFSVEAAIRDFLNAFPEETLKKVAVWAKHKNYHVRRLASEGTRPNLPWAKKIHLAPESTVPILDSLYSDNTRYVTRSVANHLNDLSKKNPKLLVATLKRWQKEKRQSSTELTFITKHALRTLVKQGNKEALLLLGFAEPQVVLTDFTLKNKTVAVGEFLNFSISLTTKAQVPQAVLIDYIVHFKKANGNLTPKVFKLGKITLEPLETHVMSKLHPLRLMSTRVLYPGEHQLQIQVNGQSLGVLPFTLR